MGRGKNGRDAYRRVVATVAGMSFREVSKKTMAMWRATIREQVNAWAQMAKFFNHADVQPYLQGLVNSFDKTWKCLRSREDEAQNSEVDYVVRGYGVSLCYNTTLGQNDPQVIKLLQSSIKGDALRTAMGEMPLYREALDQAWDHFASLGRKLGFPVTAVGIEHSERSDRPGRVHFHVTMNIDIRGGLIGKGVAQVAVKKSVFEWRGLTAHIRAALMLLLVCRRTCTARMCAVKPCHSKTDFLTAT